MFARGAGRWLLAAWAVAAAAGFAAALTLTHASSSLGPSSVWLGITVGLVALAGFLSVFFRDPERRIGPGIVSAADGRVREVAEEGDAWRISVFMNVTNVHVNRAPIDARVVRVENGGRGFRPAYEPGASVNVQRRYELATTLGTVAVVQITGVVARRLVSWVVPGRNLVKGERFGMIAFGSRVDVLLPASRTVPTVAVGDHVRAGVSQIASER